MLKFIQYLILKFYFCYYEFINCWIRRREHTFAWKIHKSNHDVNIFMTNPNAGCAKIVTPLIIDITNFELLKAINSFTILFHLF